MSSEIHVFFRGKLPTKATLTRAMKDLGFPLLVKAGFGSLENQNGFMPMALRREETGVEFDVFEGRAAIDEFDAGDVDPAFDRSANFRWSGDESEMLCGICAAAALAHLTGGIVFEGADGRLLPPDEAAAYARDLCESIAKPEAKHPGTRPADIKRYLKPLLKKNGNLALFGRLLVIRPVRHLLRGAYFGRTSDRYRFRVYPYLCPLYHAGSLGYCRDIHPAQWHVYEPYFETFLMDCLAEDVFRPLGVITTLEAFATRIEDNFQQFDTERVIALTLAGKSGMAHDYVDHIERERAADNPYYRTWAQQQRSFLARDIVEICSEFHALEAAAAKREKLESIWEPSPFPAEISAAQRTEKCSEPIFMPAPWVDGPPGFIEGAPTAPGTVRFAKTTVDRRGAPVLVAPLSREEAEARHNNRENYVLMTRLAEGPLLVLHHHTGWSPHDPEQPRNPDYVPRREFNVWIYGSKSIVRAGICEFRAAPGCVLMWSMSIRNLDFTEIWHAHNDVRERKKTVHDHQNGRSEYRSQALSENDLTLCEFKIPPFEDYQDLWIRIEKYLENEGGKFLI